MTQTDTDLRPNVFKTSRVIASAIALSLISLFILPTGIANAAACTATFCATATATGSNPIVHSSIPVSLSFTNNGSPISGAIVDIEIYDSQNTRIHQYIIERQYLPTTGTKIFSTSFTPKSTGTYTVKVGVFSAGWAQIYTWKNGAVSVIVGDASTLPPVEAPHELQVWWPTDGATIESIQPLKAMVEGTDVHDYEMFWQVDGDQLNIMYNNDEGYPHKEVWIDVSGWRWRENGLYTINFVVKNRVGGVLMQKEVSILIQ